MVGVQFIELHDVGEFLERFVRKARCVGNLRLIGSVESIAFWLSFNFITPRAELQSQVILVALLVDDHVERLVAIAEFCDRLALSLRT